MDSGKSSLSARSRLPGSIQERLQNIIDMCDDAEAGRWPAEAAIVEIRKVAADVLSLPSEHDTKEPYRSGTNEIGPTTICPACVVQDPRLRLCEKHQVGAGEAAALSPPGKVQFGPDGYGRRARIGVDAGTDRVEGEAAALDAFPLKVDGDTSDGYHTFRELYAYRKAYNALLFNEWAARGLYDVHKSWRHSDGELAFGGGWFVVVAQMPSGQISNHYETDDWDLFRVPERQRGAEYDGHTPQVALHRLIQQALEGSVLLDASLTSDDAVRAAFVAGWDAQRRGVDESGHAGEVVYAWLAYSASLAASTPPPAAPPSRPR